MNDPHLISFPTLELGRDQRSRLNGVTSLSRSLRLRSERGAATAEYAITTLAAVGFAGLLVVVLRSGEVRGMLTDIVRSALSIPA
ncbi:DUF4244 domain-containing protein [Salinibacterium amurskyense]|uniref:DUF4244 domain-containing protein n=1 Tax=Salinibacterium amurskyense TaxID=205941 RepID=UPI00311D96B1